MWTRQFAAYVLVTAAGLLIVSNMRQPAAASQATPRQFWEYKSIIELSQNDIAVAENGLLNQAGTVGWELVAVGEGPAPRSKQYFLKRIRTAPLD